MCADRVVLSLVTDKRIEKEDKYLQEIDFYERI